MRHEQCISRGGYVLLSGMITFDCLLEARLPYFARHKLCIYRIRELHILLQYVANLPYCEFCMYYLRLGAPSRICLVQVEDVD